LARPLTDDGRVLALTAETFPAVTLQSYVWQDGAVVADLGGGAAGMSDVNEAAGLPGAPTTRRAGRTRCCGSTAVPSTSGCRRVPPRGAALQIAPDGSVHGTVTRPDGADVTVDVYRWWVSGG
jgi:hypothetical protein